MSIITTFPDIRGSVVYPFCYEIDHHTFTILSLFRFGDHVLFSLRSRLLEVVGARKNGARERDTRIFSRARSALYVAGTCFTSTFPQLRKWWAQVRTGSASETRVSSSAHVLPYMLQGQVTSTFPQLRSPPPSCQPREK